MLLQENLNIQQFFRKNERKNRTRIATYSFIAFLKCDGSAKIEMAKRQNNNYNLLHKIEFFFSVTAGTILSCKRDQYQDLQNGTT